VEKQHKYYANKYRNSKKLVLTSSDGSIEWSCVVPSCIAQALFEAAINHGLANGIGQVSLFDRKTSPTVEWVEENQAQADATQDPHGSGECGSP